MTVDRSKVVPFEIADVSIGSVSTRASTAIFVILCSLPLITTLLYGGVDAIVLGISSMIAALIIILWFRDAWVTGGFRLNTNVLQLPIIGLIGIGIVQLLPFSDHGVAGGILSVGSVRSLSLDPFGTQMFTARLFVNLVFFAAALAFVDSSERATRVATVIVVFGGLIAFFGILNRLANPEAIYGLRVTPQAISFGPFINQHHFAAFMVITFGLSLGMLLASGVKNEIKAFLLLAAILAAIGLVLTGSRGGVLSFAGAIIFAVAATYGSTKGKEDTRKNRKALTAITSIAGAAAVGLIVVGAVFYLGGGDSLLRGFGASENMTDVSSGRIHFWKTAIEIIKTYPVLGAGLESFGVAFTQFDTQNGMFRVENAHNEYLQMLAEGGILGFLCLAGFLFFLFRNGIKNLLATQTPLMRGVIIGSLASCFGMAIHSFFDFPLRTPSNALFFLLLAVLATTPFKRQTRDL